MQTGEPEPVDLCGIRLVLEKILVQLRCLKVSPSRFEVAISVANLDYCGNVDDGGARALGEVILPRALRPVHCESGRADQSLKSSVVAAGLN